MRVTTALQVVGDLRDTPLLKEIAQDTAHLLLEGCLRMRDSRGTVCVDTNTFEGCNHATILYGVLGKGDLVECLG